MDAAAVKPRPGRYHLAMTANGRVVMHSWWNSQPIARTKFTQLVGEQG